VSQVCALSAMEFGMMEFPECGTNLMQDGILVGMRVSYLCAGLRILNAPSAWSAVDEGGHRTVYCVEDGLTRKDAE